MTDSSNGKFFLKTLTVHFLNKKGRVSEREEGLACGYNRVADVLSTGRPPALRTPLKKELFE